MEGFFEKCPADWLTRQTLELPTIRPPSRPRHYGTANHLCPILRNQKPLPILFQLRRLGLPVQRS